jgi:hypothetical protein
MAAFKALINKECTAIFCLCVPELNYEKNITNSCILELMSVYVTQSLENVVNRVVTIKFEGFHKLRNF